MRVHVHHHTERGEQLCRVGSRDWTGISQLMPQVSLTRAISLASEQFLNFYIKQNSCKELDFQYQKNEQFPETNDLFGGLRRRIWTRGLPWKVQAQGCYKYRAIRGVFSTYKGKITVLNSLLWEPMHLWSSLPRPWPSNCSTPCVSSMSLWQSFPTSEGQAACFRSKPTLGQMYIIWEDLKIWARI